MANRKKSSRPARARTSKSAESVAVSLEALPELLTVREFMQASRLGRTTAYALLQSGALPVVRFGPSVDTQSRPLMDS